MNEDRLEKAVWEIARAISRLECGGTTEGPGGLEALAVCLGAPDWKGRTLANGSFAIAGALDKVAEALERIAEKLP